jgi:predicted MFS family arabinose efflux permease
VSLPITAEQRLTLATLALAAFASQASVRLCDPMLPQLARDFGRAAPEVAGVVTAFTIAYGLLQLVYGPMGDRFGKLLVVAFATVAAALGSAACALAPGLGSLTALRFVTGAACAGVIPLALAWIGDSVEYQHRQRTLARFLTGSTSGLIFGQVAGGVFADTVGWRVAFAIVAVVMAIASALLWRRWRAQRRAGPTPHAGAPADPRAGAGAPPVAIAAPPAAPHALSPSGVARQFAAVLSVGWARAMLAFVAIEGALVFSATAFIPTYLHVAHGMPLWRAGLVVAGFGAGGLVYALTAAWLIPRLGERGLVTAGGACFCAGALAIGGPSLPLEMAKCFVAGAGFFMLHNTLQTQATQMAPAMRGTAISAFAFGLFVGQSAGVAAAALVVSRIGFDALFTADAVLVAVLALTVRAASGARARRQDIVMRRAQD